MALTPDIAARMSVKQQIQYAMEALYNMDSVKATINKEHTKDTPARIATAMMDMISGCWENPKTVLKTTFANYIRNLEDVKYIGPEGRVYDEIVYVNSIRFVSVCAHHHLPFFGKAHFGYLPGESIVGLSKIPRLVEVYSKRPQVQEKLTSEIVDTFMDVIKPAGCGLIMEAYHLCMNIRGVENESAFTKTTALRGCFKDNSTKQEFLRGVSKVTETIWP